MFLSFSARSEVNLNANTFKKMYEQDILTDVEVHCSGKIYKCHRAVLSSHSDVFAAMFKIYRLWKVEGN